MAFTIRVARGFTEDWLSSGYSVTTGGPGRASGVVVERARYRRQWSKRAARVRWTRVPRRQRSSTKALAVRSRPPAPTVEVETPAAMTTSSLDAPDLAPPEAGHEGVARAQRTRPLRGEARVLGRDALVTDQGLAVAVGGHRRERLIEDLSRSRRSAPTPARSAGHWYRRPEPPG